MVTAKHPGDSAQKPRTGNGVTVPSLIWCRSELVSVVLVRNFSRADPAGEHEP